MLKTLSTVHYTHADHGAPVMKTPQVNKEGF